MAESRTMSEFRAYVASDRIVYPSDRARLETIEAAERLDIVIRGGAIVITWDGRPLVAAVESYRHMFIAACNIAYDLKTVRAVRELATLADAAALVRWNVERVWYEFAPRETEEVTP